MDLYQLIYLSKAAVPFDQQSLHVLLEKARANNVQKGINGSLLFNGGRFLQVLEGKKESIQSLYEKIAQDPRHESCRQLYFEPANAPLFEKWSMFMVNLQTDTPKNLSVLKSILDDAAAGHSSGLSVPFRLLNAFRQA